MIWQNPGLQVGLEMHVKKNVLYKNFLKYKNRVTEVKYKRYKNKLTGILRKAETDYYNNLLQNHKSDLKLTWSMLNGLIKTSLGMCTLINSKELENTY